MRRERLADLLGALLLLAGLASMAIISERWWFVGLWGAATLGAAAWPGRRVVVQRGMLLLYVALPHALAARVWPVTTRGLDLTLAFYQALFLATLGVVVLAGPRGPGRMARLLFISGFGLAGAGTDYDRDRQVYAGLVAVWSVAAVLALRTERGVRPASPRAPAPPAWRTAAVVLALVVAGGTLGGIKLLNVYYDHINRAFYRLMRGRSLSAPGGFSGRAELGSIADLQGKDSTTVALRAFGPRPPGYLRARVFLAYERGRWTTADDAHKEGEGRESPDGRHVLAGRRDRLDEPTWQLHPGRRYGTFYFLPIECAVLSGTSEKVDAWPGETFVSRERGSSAGYGVHVSEDGAPWAVDADAPVWRALPDDPALLAALDRVLAGLGLSGPRTTAAEVRAAVDALRRFFDRRYTYRLGIELARGRDPVEQFLTEKDAGHCELFAASGTLLLRRLGIAARYTTGFVCLEKNAWSELYLARNKDAHAWIEVLDPERGWQTVELTPASGVPAATPPSSSLEAFLDGAAGVVERVKAAVLRFDVKALLLLLLSGVAAAMNWVLAAWWRIALVLALVAFAGGRAWLRRRARAGPGPRRLAPDLERDRERLRALERALARRDLGRAPAETLLEWTARLEDAPPEQVPERVETLVFLREYAARRYARPAVTA